MQIALRVICVATVCTASMGRRARAAHLDRILMIRSVVCLRRLMAVRMAVTRVC